MNTRWLKWGGIGLLILLALALFVVALASLYVVGAFIVPGGYEPAIRWTVLALLVLILFTGGSSASR